MLLKAGWTEPLTREGGTLEADGRNSSTGEGEEWGEVEFESRPMTEKRARNILQEKEDAWQIAQSMWNDLLSVQSEMNVSAWNSLRSMLYANILIAKSARFEAEARVALDRASESGNTPDWATIKYAVEKLKEMKSEWESVYGLGNDYRKGK
ncbi:MAG: hypothetical protein ABIA63_14175, partial [bacterium]